MKAGLTFTLPEETDEFEMYCSAPKYHTVLWAMDSWLRSLDREVTVIEVRNKLNEFMEEENVQFY